MAGVGWHQRLRFASRVIIRVTVRLPPSSVVHLQSYADSTAAITERSGMWRRPRSSVRLVPTRGLSQRAAVRSRLSQTLDSDPHGSGPNWVSSLGGSVKKAIAVQLKWRTACTDSRIEGAHSHRSSTHNGGTEDSCLLACNAVSWYEWFPTFRRNVVPSFSPSDIASCPKDPNHQLVPTLTPCMFPWNTASVKRFVIYTSLALSAQYVAIKQYWHKHRH